MTPRINDIWVYLAATPLLGLTLTLVVYQAAYWLYARSRFNPLLNPVPVAVATVVILLVATGTDYATYFEGAKFVHFLLGPATVALAIPLYTQFEKLKSIIGPLLITLVCGSLFAMGSAVGIAWLLGAGEVTLISIAPKSVTTAIAMGISEKLGGLPTVTTVMVLLTGVIGAVTGKYILDLLRIEDWSVRGFAVGLASHGIGMARAFQVSEEAGAFAGLAMGMNGLATALMFPFLVRLFSGG